MTTKATPAPQAVQAPPAGDAPEPVVDEKAQLQAEAEALRKKVAELEPAAQEAVKLRNDVKSLTGRLRGQVTTEQLDDLRGEIGGLTTAFRALAKAQANDEVSAALDKSSAEQAAARHQQKGQALYAQFNEAVKDDDGKPILDLSTAPELEQERQDWLAAWKQGDVAELALIVGRTQRKTQAAERKQLRAAAERAVKEAEAERNNHAATQAELKKVKGAAMDVDAGKGAPSGGPSLDALRQVDTRGFTPKQMEEHGKKLDAARKAQYGF